MAVSSLRHPLALLVSLCALLTVGCETTPLETGDTAVITQTSSAGCIACHGCQESLEAEVDPDTGEPEEEESGDG